MPSRVKVFFDGGCRPTPGRMEIAVVVRGQTIIHPDVGYGTSADAEWLALIQALSIAQALRLPDFVLLGDNADVIAKARGLLRGGSADAHHLKRFRDIAGPNHVARVRYIRRSQNLAGIALARLHGR